MADMTIERRIGGLVAGCDEAGRGSWAGPIVAAAVILPPDAILPGVNDSKAVNKKNHRALADVIMQKAVAVGIGIAGNQFIDEKGISYAKPICDKKGSRKPGYRPGLFTDRWRHAAEN